MTFVIGRQRADPSAGQTARLGTYRARDGSRGADLALDVDGPHAILVVGKRGYGKSYTLGVLAEALACTRGLAPVVVDPMGGFATLAEPAAGDVSVPATVIPEPTVPPAALDPRSWCRVLGLSPESGAGGLVWQAAAGAETLPEMCEQVRASDAPAADVRAAVNHLDLARSWGVFDADGLSAARLATSPVTVLDVSGLDAAPMNAVVRTVAEGLYRARVSDTIDRLPWLLVDEAHAFVDGVAAGALETLLTRGRAPGVSLVLATQRPSAVSDVAVSQSDVLVAHRLTARADLEALASARPTYLDATLEERLPTAPGDVLVVDDVTESVHAARIRDRHTPHGGASPSLQSAGEGR
ncbi:MAG: hypothetical protein ACI8XM_002352 [Haloarculaceae archaeon]